MQLTLRKCDDRQRVDGIWVAQTLQGEIAIVHLEEELHRGKGVGFGLGEELFAPNYRHYLPGSPDPLDLKGHVQVGIMFYSAIPDARPVSITGKPVSCYN